MSSAYAFSNNEKKKFDRTELGLPVSQPLSNGQFILDICTESDVNPLYQIFESIIEEGQSYPQESINEEDFGKYFLSHYAFVVRFASSDQIYDSKVVGGFYIKPNFPGRSSHLANYGLVVDNQYRGLGMGNFMVTNCIRLARLVGFGALYTNLVYANNTASIKACQRHGFIQVGRVPNAGNLKGLGYTDAFQFYRDLTNE